MNAEPSTDPDPKNNGRTRNTLDVNVQRPQWLFSSRQFLAPAWKLFQLSSLYLCYRKNTGIQKTWKNGQKCVITWTTPIYCTPETGFSPVRWVPSVPSRILLLSRAPDPLNRQIYSIRWIYRAAPNVTPSCRSPFCLRCVRLFLPGFQEPELFIFPSTSPYGGWFLQDKL